MLAYCCHSVHFCLVRITSESPVVCALPSLQRDAQSYIDLQPCLRNSVFLFPICPSFLFAFTASAFCCYPWPVLVVHTKVWREQGADAHCMARVHAGNGPDHGRGALRRGAGCAGGHHWHVRVRHPACVFQHFPAGGPVEYLPLLPDINPCLNRALPLSFSFSGSVFHSLARSLSLRLSHAH